METRVRSIRATPDEASLLKLSTIAACWKWWAHAAASGRLQQLETTLSQVS